MTTKILKFQSNQAGPFNVDNNKVDVVIPSYVEYCDLSRSCIVLNLNLRNGVAGNANFGKKIGLVDASFNYNLDPSCLIKNCSLVSDTVGTIEDIPASNYLNTNLDYYTMDFEDERGGSTYGYDSQNNIGTFLRKNKSGSTKSRQETFLQIPISRLFGIGQTKQFPSNMLGNCKIHLEFEDDKVNIIPKLFKKQVDPVKYKVTTDVGKKVFTLPSNLQQNFNLYVGQSVTIADDVDGSNPEPKEIMSIEYVGSNILVTINTAGTNAPIYIYARDPSGVDIGGVTYEISDVQLKLYQYNLGAKQVQSMNSKLKNGLTMEYLTYSLERVNLPTVSANTSYDRQFEIEPNCINAFCMVPIEDGVAGKLRPFFTRRDNIDRYRWRLNGIDTTDRDIEPFKSLYHDRLMASLSSGVFKVKNLRLANADGGNETKDSIFMMPQPIPLSDKNQVLQLRAYQNDTASTPQKTLYLYKQVQKKIRLKGQQAVVD